ncbi:hypothetical protein quinque_006693 [Culex quinquefasciatus]|uniref:sterol O-acyltransferase 1 n=1 Tax=Culex quinquefasciatus TaxID=7176 RepID=UPI0018E3114A|nr:sterol O-acyltransferase 1 [Culex quinquefasciatus]
MDCINKDGVDSDFRRRVQNTPERISPEFYDAAHKSEHTCVKRIRLKEFACRESLLTELLEVPHIRSIRRLFVGIFCMAILLTVLYNLAEFGTLNLGLGVFQAGFAKPHLSLAVWVTMQTATFCVYPCFIGWACYRKRLKHGVLRAVCDYAYYLGVFTFQCSFLVLVTCSVVWLELPPAATVAVLMEMLRFVMKIHAFFWSNVSRVVDNSTGVASFRQFAYFLFAPTLVYRDEYPRTSGIRWPVVFRHLKEFVCCVWFFSLVYEWLVFRQIGSLGAVKLSGGQFILAFFSASAAGLTSVLLFFYCVQHCWSNAVAEVMCFGDRQFYDDWWNAHTFAQYMRRWNGIVHDWLHTYVYRESIELVFRERRWLGTVLVFTISAFFHEVVITAAFRNLYPVMAIQFEVGGLTFMFVKVHMSQGLGNTMLWIMHCLGNGVHVLLYAMEYYARRNCPADMGSLLHYAVPVSWSCNGIALSGNWSTSWN